MKKILIATAMLLSSITMAQACEIESHMKKCMEVGKFDDTTQDIVINGQPSSDFKTSILGSNYLIITYTKPITQNLNGFVIVKDKTGKEMFRRPVSVTTKVINDGSSIPKGMVNILEKLKQ